MSDRTRWQLAAASCCSRSHADDDDLSGWTCVMSARRTGEENMRSCHHTWNAAVPALQMPLTHQEHVKVVDAVVADFITFWWFWVSGFFSMVANFRNQTHDPLMPQRSNSQIEHVIPFGLAGVVHGHSADDRCSTGRASLAQRFATC